MLTRVNRLRHFIYLLLFILLWNISPLAFSGIVDEISIDEKNNSVQIKVNNLEREEYDAFLLQYPQRLVLDLNTDVDCTARTLRKNIVITNIRYARHSTECRIVFDLNKNKTFGYTKHYISKNSSLVVNIAPIETIYSKKNNVKEREAIVFIDVGHGGKDPGAVGATGTKEKHITLSTAKYLAKIINQSYGMHAILGRTNDRYMHLRQRMRLAQSSKADLFISIHADSEPTRYAEGASVYILSNKGASSEAARILARRENESNWLIDDNLRGEDKNLASILIDLSQTASLSHSRALAKEILRALGKRVKKNRVESANFVVLKSVDIPSVLIELGYLSNPSDERKLKTSLYRQNLSELMLNGIKNYFARYATSNLLLAHSSLRNYRVQSGDTLSHIAERFGASVKDIRLASKLSSNKIRVGQILYIPSR